MQEYDEWSNNLTLLLRWKIERITNILWSNKEKFNSVKKCLLKQLNTYKIIINNASGYFVKNYFGVDSTHYATGL